jgi:uncharacterized protein (DUF2461 family)
MERGERGSRNGSNTEFLGFSSDAFGFLKVLSVRQSREWFRANKDVFERECTGPLVALVRRPLTRGLCADGDRLTDTIVSFAVAAHPLLQFGWAALP